MLKFKNFLKQLNEQTYKEKFAALLKDMGVSSVKELNQEQKKKLFNKMDSMHVSKAEKKAMTEMAFEALMEAAADYTEFKVGDSVEICDGEHKGSCGKIESHDDDKKTFILNLNGKKMAFPRYSFVPFFGGAFYGGNSNHSGDNSGSDSGSTGGGMGESYIEKFANIYCDQEKTILISEGLELEKGSKFETILSPRLFESSTVEINNKIRLAKKLMTESSVFVTDYLHQSEMFENAKTAESFLKDQFQTVIIVEGTKEYPVFACFNGEKLEEEQIEEDVNGIAPGQQVMIVGDKWVNNSKKGVVVGHMPVTGVFYNVRFPDGTMAIYDASSISKAETEGVQVPTGDVGSTKLEEGFINHRELASSGMMHNSMAKHMKVGGVMDFYSSKDGDKVTGKVLKNDGETVEIKQDGGSIHKFKVTEKSALSEGENKEMKGEDPCWKNYEMVGTKKKDGKEVPNCVPIKEEEEELEEGHDLKPGDKVNFETSKYNKENKGVVKSVDGEIVTVTGKNWLGGDQDYEIHHSLMRKLSEEFEFEDLKEAKMTDAQKEKREEIVKAMKDKKEELMKKYGDDWENVMYATATKKAMMENVNDDVSILKSLAIQSPEHRAHIMILSDFVEKNKMEHAKEFFHQLPENIKDEIERMVSPELCKALCG